VGAIDPRVAGRHARGVRIEVFQHVPFEGLGTIAGWAEARGARVGWTRWFEAGASATAAEGIDLLVVLGGPMSVNDGMPWLEVEREAIRRVVDAGGAVLGICLGAQQIARAFGGVVAAGEEREIGWWPVHGVEGAGGRFGDLFAGECEVFHWHGEVCGLPEGARRLAFSRYCANQAFAIGERVLALQFHLETTAESVRALVEHCPEDLEPGPGVQGVEEILAWPTGEANRLMGRVLDRLCPGG